MRTDSWKARCQALAAAIAIVLAGPAALAQSSFSPEVTAPAHLDLSFDFLGSVERRAAGGFEWYFPDATVGLPGGVEAGIGWSSTMTSAGLSREWIPGLKWRFLESHGVSLAAATEWHLASGGDNGSRYGVVYAAASREFGGRHPIAVNAGVYTLVDRVPAGDTRHGISLGFSQAVREKWAVEVDWTSGDNWYGYLASGLAFEAGRQSIFAGYCVGNDPRANHGPCVTTARTF